MFLFVQILRSQHSKIPKRLINAWIGAMPSLSTLSTLALEFWVTIEI